MKKGNLDFKISIDPSRAIKQMNKIHKAATKVRMALGELYDLMEKSNTINIEITYSQKENTSIWERIKYFFHYGTN